MANPSRQPGAKSTASRAEPQLEQRDDEIQPYGTLARYPLALDESARKASVAALNQVLVDTMVLRDLYKKHHWQVAGHTFYQLHLLFDKHYEQHSKLVDELAERIQSLGGIAIAMAHDVVEMTRIERAPRGRETVPRQITRLLEAHEEIIGTVREAAREAGKNGDDGTNDLLVSDVLRTNEMQVWFLSEHLVDTPVVPIRSE